MLIFSYLDNLGFLGSSSLLSQSRRGCIALILQLLCQLVIVICVVASGVGAFLELSWLLDLRLYGALAGLSCLATTDKRRRLFNRLVDDLIFDALAREAGDQSKRCVVARDGN